MALLEVLSDLFEVEGEPPPPPTPPSVDLSRLVTQFRGKARIATVLRSILLEVEAAKEAVESLRDGRALAHAAGAQLDGIGQVVGLRRGSMGDAEYRARLQVQIRINLADGTPEDILETLALILGRTSGISMTEQSPAELTVIVQRAVSYPVGKAAADALRQIKPAAVSAWIEWNTDPTTSFCFAEGPGLGFGQGRFVDVEAS